MHAQRKAAVTDANGIFNFMGSQFQSWTCSKLRIAVPGGLGRKILQQQQQHGHGAYSAPARENV